MSNRMNGVNRSEQLPLVSIVVTAYNNSDTIEECLDSLYSQTYPNKEILVVCDTPSSDDTLFKVRNYIKDKLNSRMIECYMAGRSKARNVGWRNSSGSIIMFADGDDVYEPWFISKAVQALQLGKRFGGVCLGGKALKERQNLLYQYYESYGETDERIDPESPDWAEVYTRESLEEVGGFDESLSQAEDKDLCNRVKSAGYKIAYVRGVNWYHRKPNTILQFFVKEYNAGKRRIMINLKKKEYGQIIISLSPFLFTLTILLLLFINAFLAMVFFTTGIILYVAYVYKKRGKNTGLSFFFALAGLVILAKIVYSYGSLWGIILLTAKRMHLISVNLARF